MADSYFREALVKRSGHILGIAVILGVVFMSGTARAQFQAPITGIAKFEALCAAVNGEFEGPGSGSTCTWIAPGPSQIVVSREVPGNGDWTVEVTTFIEYVATWYNASARGVTVDSTLLGNEITRCWNPGGQEMDLSHQHCQLD
jgi:hypothetical protein